MFKCDMCGECCRNLNMFSHMYDDLHDGDGVCRYLRGNLCSIYVERPLACRIDESYEEFFSASMTQEQYYALNREMCGRFQRAAGTVSAENDAS